MPESITERLSSLHSLSRDALCHLWKELFAASPAPQLRRDFMIPILAYRLQEQAFGSLQEKSRKRLLQLARAFEIDPKATTARTSSLRPGTRLVRQWGNHVHLVNVETKGYEYKGVRYKSLSEIARLITGTRWSGPLFFGIKNGQPGNKSKEAQ